MQKYNGLVVGEVKNMELECVFVDEFSEFVY